MCSAPLELFLQSLAKKLLCVMQQNQLLSVLQLNGFLFPGGAGKGDPVERNWSLGRTDTEPIQDRYESGVCCANPCKTDTGKKLVVEASALQQYPRSAESVPNKSASSYISYTLLCKSTRSVHGYVFIRLAALQ